MTDSGGGRSIGEVIEDSMMAIKGFVECVGALGWCVVLLVLDHLSYFFPKRKNFRGETILITGALRVCGCVDACTHMPASKAAGSTRDAGGDGRGGWRSIDLTEWMPLRLGK